MSELESDKIDAAVRTVKAMGDAGCVWRSGILRAPFVVFVTFASVVLTAFLRGYGSWVHLMISPATVILVLASLGAACIYGNLIKYSITIKDAFMIILFSVVISFFSYDVGWYARLLCLLPFRNDAAQLVSALDKYKSDHGSYPTDAKYIPSLSLPKDVHIYQGVYSNGQATWTVYELGKSDITVLVEPKEYGIYVPVEKMSPISFSSFAVYRYLSAEPKWLLGRVHWNISEAYWTEK
jgi:hypothetical protein